MLNFYDFEVTKYDWMVVIINPIEHIDITIINDVDKLTDYYNKHKNDIWIGYNNRHYDQYVMQGILAGFNPWLVNDWIINKKQPGWSFSKVLKQFPMINYDIQLLGKSLKQLEGFQGHNIHESKIDFTIDRPMTKSELKEMADYCHNDVEEAANVWMQCKSDYDAQMALIKMFNLPLSAMGKTKAQIVADILECEKTKFDDEWDISILDCIQLKKKRWLTVKKEKKVIEKVYMSPAEWFTTPKYQDYKMFFECEIAGVKHTFGWGGIHGAKDKYIYECDDDHYMIHVDVESYYPRLMIFHNLITRAAKHPERLKESYEYRLELKHQGKKKEQAPFKIVINSGYGISKDPTSKAYDPRRANEICINGQLMLVDLIEHLEDAVPSFELIQSNTDGLIIKIHKNDFDLVDDVCYEWESRCNMVLAFDYIDKIWQGDVNNYIFVSPDGEVEKKGAYVKNLSPIDNDLPIVNKAICDCLMYGIPPKKTIYECNDYVMFQRICKLTSSFDAVTDGKQTYTNKCYRIFASKDASDLPIKRVKNVGVHKKYNKFGDTSDHSYIENGNILDMTIPSKLDKQWYVDLANKRLYEKFGIGDYDGRVI